LQPVCFRWRAEAEEAKQVLAQVAKEVRVLRAQR